MKEKRVKSNQKSKSQKCIKMNRKISQSLPCNIPMDDLKYPLDTFAPENISENVTDEVVTEDDDDISETGLGLVKTSDAQ